jgi:phospholipid-binding lipoprotein MlaA
MTNAMRARLRSLKGLAMVVALSACAAPVPPATPHDPFEAANRARFERNLALDGALGGSRADGPDRAELRRVVRNFGGNLGQPRMVVNDLLQIRPAHAFENTLRFAINSTIGIGGFFDPAGAMGLHGRRTDFGETLHVWGIGEGPYQVLPLLGPSTQRDTVGRIVDLALDPLAWLVTPAEYSGVVIARAGAMAASVVDNAPFLEANVLRSADPYAQARLLYLQNRRHHLGIRTEEDIFDPYDDLFD